MGEISRRVKWWNFPLRDCWPLWLAFTIFPFRPIFYPCLSQREKYHPKFHLETAYTFNEIPHVNRSWFFYTTVSTHGRAQWRIVKSWRINLLIQNTKRNDWGSVKMERGPQNKSINIYAMYFVTIALKDKRDEDDGSFSVRKTLPDLRKFLLQNLLSSCNVSRRLRVKSRLICSE